MRKICIISNYNYGDYLKECIESALNQSVKLDNIIVVDDGSTDNSREIIEHYVASNKSTVLPIYKANGGQLSCYNVASSELLDDDLVFFMDSDDIYPPNYIDEALKLIDKYKAPFYFSRSIIFSDKNEKPNDARLSTAPPVIIPISSQLTRLTKCWIGAPTSCIIAKGNLLKKILPFPFEEDWRTRADDVIVYGASIAGYEKVFLPSVGIGYRVHNRNRFYGTCHDKIDDLIRQQRLDRLFEWSKASFYLPDYMSLSRCFSELSTIEPNVRKDFFIPSKIKILYCYMKARLSL